MRKKVKAAFKVKSFIFKEEKWGKHFESEREPLNRDIFKKYDQTVYKAMIIRQKCSKQQR